MQVDKLKELWILEGVETSITATEESIFAFQQENSVFIPDDMKSYFVLLNGTNEVTDHKLFQFYSLKQFKSLDKDLIQWGGIPDYKNITNTLKEFNKYFVFADYSFNMFCYAIKLDNQESRNNEVLVISGDKYKKIASSFSGFIDLYFNDSIELQMNI